MGEDFLDRRQCRGYIDDLPPVSIADATPATRVVVTGIAGDAPERDLAGDEGYGLRDVVDTDRHTVIPTGTHRRIQVHRDFLDVEPEPRRFADTGRKVEQRYRFYKRLGAL